MNTFEFVRCSKNDVRVRSMFDKMVFDPSLGYAWATRKVSLVVGFWRNLVTRYRHCAILIRINTLNSYLQIIWLFKCKKVPKNLNFAQKPEPKNQIQGYSSRKSSKIVNMSKNFRMSKGTWTLPKKKTLTRKNSEPDQALFHFSFLAKKTLLICQPQHYCFTTLDLWQQK